MALCSPAAAQTRSGAAVHHGAPVTPVSGNQPVTFQADDVSYDKVNGIVSAEGHVQAWQGDHYLSADRITFDRNTDVAAAYGHVVIVEPDGQVVFADYAEMTQGMKNGVLTGMRALLADGGKLASNGARRTEGKLNELSRAVYSSCNICAIDPTRAPLWQIRAAHMTQDLEHKRIEYNDAWVDLFGLPIFYFPYMSNSDPSVKRQSGFLVPSFGATDKHLGSFLMVPYYWVLDGQSDVTITPELTTQQGGQVEADYRRVFNNGQLHVQGALATDEGEVNGYVFANALFNWNNTWRYGANINVGSSIDYLRDYRVPGYGANFLGSNAFIEGFGVGAYARLDASAYQGLNSSVSQSLLPYVLPRFSYSYFGEPDVLGGRVTFDTMAFDVLRTEGTSDQRIGARIAWDRPFSGLLGEQYEVTAEVRGAAYHATALNGQPNYGTVNNADTVHAQPQVAVRLNWPFVRDAGSLGTQILEPIVQVIAAPNAGNSVRDHIPNEDSLDYEFTDSTLFNLNRFGGYDRYDGGTRANFALHANWIFRGGQSLDALAGASWQEHIDQNLYPQFQPWNGFERGQHLSDIVSRVRFAPYKWVDFTVRGRFDHNSGDVKLADGVIGVGRPLLRVSAGYFYGATNPYLLYLQNFYTSGFLAPANTEGVFFTPRQEAEVAVSSHVGHWTVSGNGQRDLQTGNLVGLGAEGKYEDECSIFDILFARRYTSINYDHGDTTVLFTVTLKTVGQVGFNG